MAEGGTSIPFDVDRTALFLMRRYGDDCACVAHLRASWCARLGDGAAAVAWRRVLERCVDLHFTRRSGPLQ